MADVKKDLDGVGLEIEAPGVSRGPIEMPNLPKPLTLEEKKYLLAVERGDIANVTRMLQLAPRRHHINVNCLDPLGRGALTLSIDGENLEMVELLVVMGVETRDALLHAINAEFVEAVELLLEHEELIHKEGEPYSWQKVDWNTGNFTPDITPLVLAAHKNNYEIIKILLDRGATLPMPHDIKCGCEECLRESLEDSLRFSQSRVNEYRALASPSLIALSSNDPILTAFQLSWELRNLAFAEQECKADYMELRRQCQKFAVDLLHQSRSSQELAVILNHDPDSSPYEQGEHMKLARLELAIKYKQKKFVAHPNIQQLLAAIWYEGVPGFRRKPMLKKCMEISRVALLFPFYCMLYMIAPNTPTGKLMRKPFMKFLIHASSYLFFLLILILVSQRAEIQVIQMFGTESMRKALAEQLLKQRGQGPSPLEWIVVIYVLGFIWEETHEIYLEGIDSYLRNMWNFIDFTRNSLYFAVAVLRVAAYIQQSSEIAANPAIAYIPREQWNDFDPQLIAEGLFAGANIFSALKLVHLFSINPHLGPLQISLGRMVIDIVKFFFIYSLVLFAFACGLNQLLWYFAELERRKCYCLPGGLPDWDNHGDSCMKWRSFGNLFESSQSLFWASFGGIGIDSFELAGIKTYTRFWGLLMFGSYSVINVIVLLNLLIAMMSNSYAMIDEHSDTEWKFARTRLWMSYFEESATLPPPFNIFPTPKLVVKILGLRKKDKLRRMSSKRKERHEKERDYRYTAVMRALVWRYVTAMHRHAEENPVTEDDINEVKGEISAMKCQVMEVLSKNGMDVSNADTTEKTILGKKMRVWERRLMKDFHVAPVAAEEDMDQLLNEPPPEDEDALSRFRRVARLAVLNSSSHKWGQVLRGACLASQIGRCNNRESFKNQQNLQKAMKEAQALVCTSPVPGSSPYMSPMPLPSTGLAILEMLQNIKEEVAETSVPLRRMPKGGGGVGGGSAVGQSHLSVNNNLQVQRSPQGATMSGIKMQIQPATPKNISQGCAMVDNKLQKNAAPKAMPRPSTSQQGGTGDQKPAQTSLPVVGQSVKKPTVQTAPSAASTPVAKPTQTVAAPQPSEATSSTAPQPNNPADPSPLIPQRKIVGGESPPKVVKRKAPIAGQAEVTDSTVGKKDVVQIDVEPPLVAETNVPKVSAGQSNALQVKAEKPGSPKDVNQATTSTAGPSKLPETKQQVSTILPVVHTPAQLAPKDLKSSPPATAEVRKSAPTVPQFEMTLANAENSSNLGTTCAGSTEQLIGSRQSSPAPLRPGKRIEDVNTIKRQPKGGWL